jgi:hypothetical protein
VDLNAKDPEERGEEVENPAAPALEGAIEISFNEFLSLSRASPELFARSFRRGKLLPHQPHFRFKFYCFSLGFSPHG